MSDDTKDLPGGPVWHHGERSKPFALALGSEDTELLESHIENHFGKVETVFHELLSDLVHIDVHAIPASPGREFVTLVTTGMSDLPMSAPDGVEGSRYAELLIHLPADWPITDEAFEEERFYWPVRLIKTLARFPHEYDTWLWWGHTLPNGEPAERYEASVSYTCAILKESSVFQPETTVARCSAEKSVQFFAVAPLYPEELQLKLRKGADALFSRWQRRNIVAELVTNDRPNVARRSWWPF